MPPEAGAPPAPFVGIILAAQRAGVVDPLAAEAGVSHKCLVPIGGAPLIAHVAAVLFAAPGLDRLRIVVEADAADAVRAALPPGPIAPEFVASADNLADSVFAAACDLDQPVVVTTADNVLLTPPAVAAMRASLAGGADVALAMAPEASVRAAHPDGQRRFYRFADDAYSNCNLYAFAGRHALKAAETFRGGGQFAKKPMRLIAFAGPINLALMWFGKLSLAGASARIGRRLRLRIAPVILADGAHAIDVDNRRTYDIAALLLAERAARPSEVELAA